MRRLHLVVTAGILSLLAFPSLTRASDKGLDLPVYRKLVLENGATVLLVPHREVPMATLQVLIRGGSTTDPAGKEGLAAMAGELIRKGAGTRSATDISGELDGRGASYGVSTDLTGTQISLDLLARDLDFGLELLADTILRPTFPEVEVFKLRDRSIDGLKAARENPQAVIPAYFARALFGSHPFGRPTSGSETTIATFTRDDVAGQWERGVSADRMIIAVGGDIDLDASEKAVRAAFGGVKKQPNPLPVLTAPARVTGRRVLLVDMPDAVQTYFWIGNIGIAQGFPDEAAFDVIRTAFGGRFTSMLNSELRIRTGLTYGARLTVEQLEQPSRLAITSFTQTEKTKEAIDLAIATLGKLHTDGLDKVTIKSTQAYLRGQLPTTLETARAVTGSILDLVRFGLPDTQLTEYFARTDAVDPAAAGKIIDSVFPKTENLVLVLIGKAEAIAEIAASYGPVERRVLADPSF